MIDFRLQSGENLIVLVDKDVLYELKSGVSSVAPHWGPAEGQFCEIATGSVSGIEKPGNNNPPTYGN